jgi:hypothetical protein
LIETIPKRKVGERWWKRVYLLVIIPAKSEVEERGREGGAYWAIEIVPNSEVGECGGARKKKSGFSIARCGFREREALERGKEEKEGR